MWAMALVDAVINVHAMQLHVCYSSRPVVHVFYRRVEALVGRSNISQAALGTSHSLFLDHDGGVWSCGENKEVGLYRSQPPGVV